MIKKELSEIKKFIESQNQFLQSSVHVFNPKEESEFRGITDTSPQYLYLQIDSDDEGENYILEPMKLSGFGGYLMRANLKLIAKIESADTEKAAEILTSQLIASGVQVVVKSISLDAEAIYFEETDDELKKHMPLIRVKFQVVKPVSFENCEDICITNC